MNEKRFFQQESRSINQIKEHYEIEKELASKLRNSTRNERRRLYASVYNELLREVPHHPRVTQKTNKDSLSKAILSQMSLLHRFLDEGDCFLEIGAGDCSLSLEVAKYVRKVIAVDVSNLISKVDSTPLNFELIITDGIDFDVDPGTVDVAYSSQVIEHVHPDDIEQHLGNIYTALVPGGVFVLTTPHCFSGPHDISKYFDDVATGLHLQEYTYSILIDMLRRVGFSRQDVYWGARSLYLRTKPSLSLRLENCLNRLRPEVRKSISHSIFFQILLGIKLVAAK